MAEKSAAAPIRQQPLTCAGHSRPVVGLAYTPVLADGSYYLISACIDGRPMLRDGATGDW
jgi:serine-threonine kinase receptor-associated protein